MNDLRRFTRTRELPLTIADYLLLEQAGAYGDIKKTELIEGRVFGVNAQLTGHSRFHSRFFQRLAGSVGPAMPGYEALIEVSLRIEPLSAPQADIAVTDFDLSIRDLVPIETVALVVEVADSSLKYDLGRKSKLYAAAGLPEYWIADLIAGVMHQRWAPRGKLFTQSREVPFGQRIVSATVPALAVETVGLL